MQMQSLAVLHACTCETEPQKKLESPRRCFRPERRMHLRVSPCHRHHQRCSAKYLSQKWHFSVYSSCVHPHKHFCTTINMRNMFRTPDKHALRVTLAVCECRRPSFLKRGWGCRRHRLTVGSSLVPRRLALTTLGSGE